MKQRAPKRPAAERRRAILESAQAVFGETGYGDAATGDIARSAGVAPSAIYRHFASKRDLYLAALREAGPRLVGIWGAAAGKAHDPLEAIQEMGLDYYDHAQSRSPYARLWFQALSEASDPEVRETIASNFLAMVDAFSGLLASGQAQGTVRKDIDTRIAAWHFMAIGHTFDLIHHLQLDEELDRDRVKRWGELYVDSIREAGHGSA